MSTSEKEDLRYPLVIRPDDPERRDRSRGSAPLCVRGMPDVREHLFTQTVRSRPVLPFRFDRCAGVGVHVIQLGPERRRCDVFPVGKQPR